MSDINTCTFTGRLGADPEIRYIPSGTAVCNFRIAVDDSYGDKKSTQWIPIVVWKQQAEACAEYLHKGSRVAVSGRWKAREWEGKDGTKRQTTEIHASTITFLDSKPKQQPKPQEDKPAETYDYDPPPMGDDELPF